MTTTKAAHRRAEREQSIADYEDNCLKNGAECSKPWTDASIDGAEQSSPHSELVGSPSHWEETRNQISGCVREKMSVLVIGL